MFKCFQLIFFWMSIIKTECSCGCIYVVNRTKAVLNHRLFVVLLFLCKFGYCRAWPAWKQRWFNDGGRSRGGDRAYHRHSFQFFRSIVVGIQRPSVIHALTAIHLGLKAETYLAWLFCVCIKYLEINPWWCLGGRSAAPLGKECMQTDRSVRGLDVEVIGLLSIM